MRGACTQVILALAAAVLVGCGGAADGGRNGRLAERAVAAAQRRFDDPGAARAYALARRAPLDPGCDIRAAYRRARARLAAMPRYSTRLGRRLDETAADGDRRLAARAAGTDLATWEPLGPGNIGGRTRVLLIDPRDDEVLYAAGVSGGVWRSEDGGGSWRALTDDLANITVNSLVMDPADPDVLYAGTGEGYFREEVRGTGLPLRGDGIWRSADGGVSWSYLKATSSADFDWVNDLAISPHDSRRVYAATRTGVWRSFDAGATWSLTLATDVTGGCLDLALRTDTEGDVLFASCGTFERASVYRNLAAEAAGMWEVVLSESAMGRTSLAIAPSDQDTVYALAASNVPGPGGHYEQSLHAVFRSTGGGAAGSWTARVRNTDASKVNTLLLTNPVIAVLEECGYGSSNGWVPMGWYVNVLAVDPVDPERVWAAGVDLFRSDDGGRSWGPASYWWPGSDEPSYVHADQHGLAFHPGWDGGANQTMYVVGDGGVFRTDNALAPVGSGTLSLCDPARSQVRWRRLNHGYGVTQFYHGAPFFNGASYLGGTQDNGTVLGGDGAGGDGWLPILGGDGGYVAVDPTNETTIYAEAQGFDFYKSTDGGMTFRSAVRGISDSEGSFLFITPFVLDPDNPRRLWTGGRRLWRSDSGASLWVPAGAWLDDGGRVSALAVAPGRPQRVLAGTEAGTIYASDDALTGGAARVWDGVRPRPGFVTWIAFDPNDPDVAYATYGGFGGAHLWRSTDAGASWTALDGEGSADLPDIPAHCILPDPTRAGRLFLATDLGVLVSTDGGASWAVERTGFASVVTESLAFATARDGRVLLFAFTHGRGAWRVEVGEGRPRRPRRRLRGS